MLKIFICTFTAHASGNPDYWARLGFASFRLKDFTQASTAYKKSLDLDSSHANRYYNLAQSYKALGEIEAAKASIKRLCKWIRKILNFWNFWAG